MLPFARRPFCLAAGLLFVLLAAGAARAASPPRVTIDSALGGGLIRGRWQPLLVTLSNGPDGQGIARGEVQVIVEDARQPGRVLSTASRAISLPGGPGVAQVIVYVRVPDGVLPHVFVQVADQASGETVTRKRMDKLPVAPEQLTIVAASDLPDALAYLRGETLGVIVENGVLRSYDDPADGNGANRFRSALQPADKVVPLNPITLPDRAAGYDGVAAVYLGDIAPDTLSNAQVAALQTWTAGGGLLVCGGPRLQTDERFRTWLPVRWGVPGTPLGPDPLAARYHTARGQITYAPLSAVPGRNARPFLGKKTNGIALAAPLGRGTLVALGFDAATTAFADWPGRADLWHDVALQGVTTPALIAALDEPAVRWNGGGATFSQSVLRAPGLRAPGFGAIGAFLLAYLVLLVPVNYAVLKRLDRRELTWLTVPVLVFLFSASAYGFGYRLKGGQIRVNTASLIEMATGDGRAGVLSSVGIFSPRRTSYNVSLAGDEALLFDPSRSGFGGASNGGQNDYAPLAVSQEPGESRARNTDISMWAMRVLNARTTTRLGQGVDARLHVRGNDLVGTVANRTGRDLDDVTALIAGQRQTVGVLRSGESKAVRLAGAARFLHDRSRNPFPDDWQSRWNGVIDVPEAKRTREGIRRMVREAVFDGMTNREQLPGAKTSGGVHEAAPVLVTAWSYDPLLPLRVNGRTVPDGDNVSLLIVHVPVIAAARR